MGVLIMKKLVAEILLILIIILASIGCSYECTTPDSPYAPQGGCETSGDNIPGIPDPPPSCGLFQSFDWCTCECEWRGL